jgi:hypothetical protein
LGKTVTALCLLAFFAFWPAATLLAIDRATFYAPGGGRATKQYLPGDFVHIIVDAPVDTASITSILPNGEQVELAHDRRANIWHGLWQVPIGFKPGTYTAGLQARDIEGNMFEGETSPFIIGELSLITMIKISASTEARARTENREQTSRRLEVETAKLAVQPKPAPPPKKKRPSLARKPRPAPRKKMVLVEVLGKNKELNLKKAKLLTTTRYYMEKMDFDTVRSLLKSLVAIDPANKEYQKMLRRVEVVIKTEKEKH